MPYNIGTNYVVQIPTLQDGASIVEAFQSYHRGNKDGTLGSNGIETHLNTITNRIASIENTAIGYPYTNGNTISTRLNDLETKSGNVADKYIKTTPTSMTDANTKNFIVAGGSQIVPLTISGVNGQEVDLQRWFIYSDTNPRARISTTGAMFSYDGTSVAEVATVSGDQELTNKVITNRVLTVSATSANADSINYRGRFVNFTSTSPKTFQILANATFTGFPVGTTITITNMAATGNLTVSAAAGVTLLSQDNRRIIFPYGSALLFKVDVNTWTLNFMSKERQTFIQTTDPGAAAIDGDIWLKY